MEELKIRIHSIDEKGRLNFQDCVGVISVVIMEDDAQVLMADH